MSLCRDLVPRLLRHGLRLFGVPLSQRAGDRLDVACRTMEVPPSWLVASRVSGPTLIKNVRWIREHGARVECPDQALQLSQLAAVHAHWTAATEARDEGDTGRRVSAIAVESNPINLHLISERAHCSGKTGQLSRQRRPPSSAMIRWARSFHH